MRIGRARYFDVTHVVHNYHFAWWGWWVVEFGGSITFGIPHAI